MSGAERTRRSRAVLVGVSSYKDTEFTQLPAAHNSLAGMHALLISAEHCDWDPRDVTVLDDPINAGHLATRIRDLARDAEDRLLIYFVGHGTITSTGGLSLALTDTAASDPDFTGLTYDRIRAALESSNAATKVVILDCCFAGRATKAMAAGEITEIGYQDGTYVLAATNRSETAHVVPLSEQATAVTSFTDALIKLVRTGIPYGPDNLTLTYLFTCLRTHLLAEGLPAPSQSSTEAAGSFTFAKNVALSSREAADAGEMASTPFPAGNDEVRQSYADTLSARILRAADHYLDQRSADWRLNAGWAVEQESVDELVQRAVAIVEDADPIRALRGFRLAFSVLRDRAATESDDPLRRSIISLFAAEVQLRGPLQLTRPQSRDLAVELSTAGRRLREEGLWLHAALAFERAAELFRDCDEPGESDECALSRARARHRARPPGVRWTLEAAADTLTGYGYLPFRVLILAPLIATVSWFSVALTASGVPANTVLYDCLIALIAPLGTGDVSVLPRSAWAVLALESYSGLVVLAIFFALLLKRWVRV